MAHRVFIVEDSKEMQMGYSLIFEDEPDLELVGMAGTGGEALSGIAEAAPDVVLVDLSLPDMSGVELTRQLVETHPHLAVLVVSGFDEGVYAKHALKAGARGYVVKDRIVEHLATAVERVVAGGEYVSPEMSG